MDDRRFDSRNLDDSVEPFNFDRPLISDGLVAALLALASVMIVASAIIATVAWLGSSCP